MGPPRAAPLLLLAAVLGCTAGPPPEPPSLAASEAKMAEGRYGEALRALRALPPAELPVASQRLRAATVAARGKDFALALSFLKAGENPSTEARLLAAESLLRSGDAAGAKEALAALEQQGLRTERWRFLYALLCLVRGERDLGIAGLDEIARGGSRDPEVLVRWAETILDHPEEARRRLTEALGRTDDRGPVEAALGACLLLKDGDPESARMHLEEAVRLNPWNRDARLDLVRAGLRKGTPTSVDRAGQEAARLLEQDPSDAVARMLLAATFGELGRMATDPGAGVPPPAAIRAWDRAEREYATLLSGPIDDPATAIQVLQGWARIHVEEVPLDPPGAALGPGSHYARAVELLEKAETIDPDGRLEGGPNGSRLIAETWFLRGRAARKAHTGSSDHTEALGYLQKAFKADPRHLGASWDLGLLCHDLFPDSKEYQDLAYRAMRAHKVMRDRAGLPSLDPEKLKIYDEVMKNAPHPVPQDPKSPAPKQPDPNPPAPKKEE